MRYGRRREFRPSPVEVNKEYDVKIEEMSRRGDAGVARIEGFIIFVPNTKPGDQVRIRITRVGRGFAQAERIWNNEHPLSARENSVPKMYCLIVDLCTGFFLGFLE